MSCSLHIEIDWPLPASSRLTIQELGELRTEAVLTILTGERLLTAQAMTLLMRIDRDMKEARVQFNEDWFRRLMRIRPIAVSRLRRRWETVFPPPLVPLGGLRRRYHPQIANSR
jgi:hypothetical protein